MQRTPVSSSNIRSIGYDASTGTLEVEFSSGDVYQYFHVPEYLNQQLMDASSYGQYLSQHIRDAYRYQKI